MKTTNQKLMDFLNEAERWGKKNPRHRDTKLGYAIEKIRKKVLTALKPITDLDEKRNEDLEDASVEFALTDKDTKAYIHDITKDKDGNEIQNFCYTKEDMKSRNEKCRKINKKHKEEVDALRDGAVEFEDSYYATELPGDLSEIEREAFTGFVIKPADE